MRESIALYPSDGDPFPISKGEVEMKGKIVSPVLGLGLVLAFGSLKAHSQVTTSYDRFENMTIVEWKTVLTPTSPRRPQDPIDLTIREPFRGRRPTIDLLKYGNFDLQLGLCSCSRIDLLLDDDLFHLPRTAGGDHDAFFQITPAILQKMASAHSAEGRLNQDFEFVLTKQQQAELQQFLDLLKQ